MLSLDHFLEWVLNGDDAGCHMKAALASCQALLLPCVVFIVPETSAFKVYSGFIRTPTEVPHY